MMYQYNDFEKSFTNQEDFAAFLSDVDADTRWSDHPINKVRFVPASNVSPQELAMGNDPAILMDSINSVLPVCAEVEGQVFLLRPYLAKAIKEHHRDTAPILGTMLSQGAVSEFCEHLNASVPFLNPRKNILMMTRGEKISGWFSEFNFGKGQGTQFADIVKTMQSDYSACEFEHGCYNHMLTEFTLSLGAADPIVGPEIADAYADAWAAAGGCKSDFQSAKACCSFTLGESGVTALGISPMLVLPNTTLYLGTVHVSHRGTDRTVWDAFDEKCSQICGIYKESLANVERLCNLDVEHPYNAMTHLLKSFRPSVPTASLKEALETVELFYPEGFKCKAISLYQAVVDMLSSNMDNISPVKRLLNRELTARLLLSDWRSFDKDKPAKLFGSKQDMPDVDWINI